MPPLIRSGTKRVYHGFWTSEEIWKMMRYWNGHLSHNSSPTSSQIGLINGYGSWTIVASTQSTHWLVITHLSTVTHSSTSSWALFKHIWKFTCPKRGKFLLWEISQSCLDTMDRLQIRCPWFFLSPWFYLCKHRPIFFSIACKFTAKI